ncbi:MAG TPA: glycosyltransferase [Chloroflexota bacterium]|nr:glycosyltransferase [Chloroflexota bacterium]
MKSTPVLSVTIPTYNRRDMLAECLASVQRTTVDCEILVIDDASTDDTADFIQKAAEADPRVRYHRQPANVGVQRNVETGLQLARGKYLAVIADDDWVEPGNYEKKLAILEQNPEVGFVYSLSYVLGENTPAPVICRRIEHLNHSYIGGRNEFLSLLPGNYIPGPSMVWRRELHRRLGGFDPDMPGTLSDWDLWLRYSADSATAYINEPLVGFRMHSAGASSIAGKDMAINMIPVWEKWLVRNPQPPVLDERTWASMYDMYRMMLQSCYGEDKDLLDAGEEQFQRLKADYFVTVTRGFAAASRRLSWPVPSEAARPAVIVSGPIWDPGDWGAEMRSIIDGLKRVATVRVEELEWRPDRLPYTHISGSPVPALQWQSLPAGKAKATIAHLPAPYLRRDPEAQALVCRASSATDGLRDPWVESFNSHCDLVVVPSAFHRDAFARAGVARDKLRVVPPCIQVAQYGTDVPPLAMNSGRSFSFLSIIEWGLQDGWDALVRAWAAEFEAAEDVALVLCANSPDKQQNDVHAEIQTLLATEFPGRSIAPIHLVFGRIAPLQLPGLMRAAQALVQPSRGDAWGRRTLAGMASQVPVICTSWGIGGELVNNDNGFPVDWELVPAAADGNLTVTAGLQWAEPSIPCLRRALREAASNRQAAERRAAAARRSCEEHFNAVSIAEAWERLLAEV